MESRINVAVIDDGSLAIQGAIKVLENSRHIHLSGVFPHVRGVYGIGEERLDSLTVIADPFAPGISPESLSEMTDRVPVLGMSAQVEQGYVLQALRSGVHGYVSKDVDPSNLVAATAAVSSGGFFLGLRIADVLFLPREMDPLEEQPARVPELTRREKDVLVMIAQGLTHKQIGNRLTLSKATVDTYAYRIRQKVGAVNKAGLTRFAVEVGLLQ
ncbi:response regulator transcription factor [Streptomyces sp. NBC_01716]|uniref:response regulator transcription factor n=1 Tax=Streptomyces sp. NBC_01716 TaxID=2975917 RepID=UPI002E334A79|nr:response regulator transcription factor [Streptomyces sp. NBC_01716]